MKGEARLEDFTPARRPEPIGLASRAKVFDVEVTSPVQHFAMADIDERPSPFVDLNSGPTGQVLPEVERSVLHWG